MKNKFKLFGLISALAIGASFSLTACGDPNVGEHDHIWGDPVTAEATCYKEGTRIYTCSVEGCTQKKSEPIAMIAHSWNDGEITKQAKCNEEGVKTYACTAEGCGKTKEEPVAKTAHRYDDGKITETPKFLMKGIKTLTCLDCKTETTESVEAHADFSEQYYTALSEQTNWLYGYANSFDAQTGAVDFVRIEQSENEKWKAEKTEIGKGHVYSENNAVIAYSFNEAIPRLVQANVSISFAGEEAATVLNAYLIIKGECVSLNKDNAKDWSYQTEKAIDIAQGDIFYLVLENNGEGKAGGSLDFTITAPCVHVWDSGKVTEEATCTKEGVREYSCISCDKKMTGVAEMIPHAYNDGDVTVEPTENSAGEKTYTCTVCGHTKTEAVPKLPSSVFNGADYARDFSTEPQGDWKYGYTNNYNYEDNTFTFNELKPYADAGAWEDNGGGIEIKAGWFKNETAGAQAVIRYIMPQTREINISLNFNGSDAVTRMIGRLVIHNQAGSVELYEFINNENGNTWNYNKNKVTVEAGSTISIVFDNVGGGYGHGAFNMTLTAEGQTVPDTEVEIGNFYEDFSFDGDGNWIYGYATDYQWNGANKDNFTFNSLTANEEKGEWGGVEGLVIKRDWVLAEGAGDLAVGYKVPEGQNKLKVAIAFAHAPDSEENGASPTRLSARVLVVGSDGKTKSVEFINKGTSSWQATQEVSVADGDTVYVILFREAEGWRQGTLQITVNGKKAEEPTVPFEGADFAQDFEATLAGESNWTVGKVDYEWSSETFTFNKITSLNAGGDALNNGEPWIEVKGDWMAVNGMMGFAYRFTSSANVNVELKLNAVSDDGKFSLRWAIKDKEGNIKNPDGKAQWVMGGHDVSFSQDITVAAGDVLYLLVNKDEGGDQNNFELTLINKDKQSVPEFEGANFAEDFTIENQDGAWGYGYMANPWDDDRHFEACTQKTDDAWIFNDGDFNKVEIKSDWIAVNKETAISYTATAAVSAKVKVEFDGADDETLMGIRIFASEGGKLVEKAFNQSKNDEGKQVVELLYDFEADETIYVMFSVANWQAATNGGFDITVTKA